MLLLIDKLQSLMLMVKLLLLFQSFNSSKLLSMTFKIKETKLKQIDLPMLQDWLILKINWLTAKPKKLPSKNN